MSVKSRVRILYPDGFISYCSGSRADSLINQGSAYQTSSNPRTITAIGTEARTWKKTPSIERDKDGNVVSVVQVMQLK